MEWRQIPGYEFIYSISEFGDVKKESKNKLLIPQLKNNGYFQIGISKSGSQRYFSIHSLVAASFLGVRPDGYEINHKDTNRQNNHYSNLEYVTKKGNAQHAVMMGRYERCSKHSSAKLDEIKVKETREEYLKGNTTLKNLAEKYSVTFGAIAKVIKHRSYTHVL